MKYILHEYAIYKISEKNYKKFKNLDKKLDEMDYEESLMLIRSIGGIRIGFIEKSFHF